MPVKNKEGDFGSSNNLLGVINVFKQGFLVKRLRFSTNTQANVIPLKEWSVNSNWDFNIQKEKGFRGYLIKFSPPGTNQTLQSVWEVAEKYLGTE